ncbi:MAG: hypothetical protein MJK04_03015, partial [Psychrosphaera sp.]|nr:hypothetical protein [Psychrosphaera sp.]
IKWLLSGGNKAALKIAPPTADLNDLLNRTKKINTVMQQFDGDTAKQFHFCLHFSRTEPGKRQEKLRQHQVKIEALQVRRLLKTQARFYHDLEGNQFRTIDDKGYPVKGEEIDLTGIIRGFDVAGNENHFPIHVFAPALRYLREKPLSIKHVDGRSELIQRRYLSIHAGEDYSHLITGLRHIDETVSYCNMGQGDRIGHALALGVMPQDWAARQQQAFAEPEECLWNTVWLLYQAKKLSVRFDQASKVVSLLELQLAKWQQQYFRRTYTHQQLWAYWENRGNAHSFDNSTKKVKNIWDRSYWVNQEIAETDQKSLTSIYFELRRLSNKTITFNLDTEVLVSTAYLSGPLSDVEVSKEELLFYQLLQDHLMMTYDNHGIVLEVCPSSNISLGRFEKYHQHPLFRWCPPCESLFESRQWDLFGIRNKGEVAICVNTDDPGIFPTKIAQEYVLLRDAAMQDYGLSSQKADLWIEKLRKLSLEVFNRAHGE